LGVVFIHAENGAVATKLRQIADSLGDEFRKRGTEVNEIRVKVQPRSGNPASADRPAGYAISDKTKRGLTSLADHLPEASPLGKALRTLVERARDEATGR
jgi:hypothetical protein